jgi:nicotinate-nucleotide adenylyltransferase
MGHLILAEYARRELYLERVVFVPAGRPWRKADVDVSPSEHRLAMVRRAVVHNPEYEVSTLEIDRGGASFTAETLAALRLERPGAEWYLLLGQDALADLANWWQPRRIVELAVLAVARRPGYEEATPEGLERRVPGIARRIVWLGMPRIDISATDIRQRVRSGRAIRFLVPAAVEDYIWQHQLYQGSPSGMVAPSNGGW